METAVSRSCPTSLTGDGFKYINNKIKEYILDLSNGEIDFFENLFHKYLAKKPENWVIEVDGHIICTPSGKTSWKRASHAKMALNNMLDSERLLLKPNSIFSSELNNEVYTPCLDTVKLANTLLKNKVVRIRQIK